MGMITMGWLVVLGLLFYVIWPYLERGIESFYVEKLEVEIVKLRVAKEEEGKPGRGKGLDIYA